MNVPAYLAIVALIAMVLFYVLEERLQQLAPLGFCAASLVVAFSVFALGHWPFGSRIRRGGVGPLVRETQSGAPCVGRQTVSSSISTRFLAARKLFVLESRYEATL
jgi:hypothetical protein